MKKRKNSVGYFSAYYRGLEPFLTKIWPKIREANPKATLDVYYGWQSWVNIEGEDDFYHRMQDIFEESKALGVTVHGRVSHEELAKAMGEIQVWAYPTEFEEIHCITALKAQEARCFPVTTNVAALDETVQSGVKIKSKAIYTDEYAQKKFVDALLAALKEEKLGTPVDGCDWSDVAKQWDTVIQEKLHARKV